MKKKKQIKSIFAAIGITAVVLGGLVMMKPSGLKAQDNNQSMNKNAGDLPDISQFATIPPENWLPLKGFSQWGDADNHVITKETPFVMLTSERSKILYASDNFDLEMFASIDDTKDNTIGYTLQEGPLELVVSNVGYYDGHAIGVKFEMVPTLDPDLPKPANGYKDEVTGARNYFRWRDFSFSMEGIGTWGTQTNNSADSNLIKVDMTITFLEDNDESKPVSIPTFLTYSNIPVPSVYFISIPKDNIKHIFSRGLSADNLQYHISDGQFMFSRIPGKPGGGNDARAEFVFADNLPQLKYTSYKTSAASFGFHYNTHPDILIQVPEPQASETTYEVTQQTVNMNDQSKNLLDLQFVQFIPYEDGEQYYTQEMTWELNAENADANNVKIGNWSIKNEDGATNNDLKLFNDTDDTITPVSIKDAGLYNHYYTFRKPITIDYTKSIEKKYIPKNNYFEANGTVDFDLVNQKLPQYSYDISQPYSTKINFGAEIDYKFVDSAGAPISADLVEASYKDYAEGTKKGKGLVTWLAPLPGKDPVAINPTDSPYTAANAPEVTGYRFKSAKLNGQVGDMQVKYSKLLRDQNEGETEPVNPDDENNYSKNNVVTLEYESLAYGVEIQVNKPDGTSLQSTANSLFEISKDNGATWLSASNYPFVAGETYEIKQSGFVSTEGYMQAAGTAKFTVSMAENGTIRVTNLTDPTNDAYSFAIENNKLKITVINEPGSLVSITAPELNYGTDNQLPSANMILQRKGAPWQIKFVDNRPESARKAPYLYVTLTKEFTEDTTGNVLPNILFFTSTAVTKPEEVKEDSYLTLNDPTLIDIQEVSPDTWAYGENTLKPWDADKGFLLNMKEAYESGKMNPGTSKYTAELTFTLAEDPIQ